MKLISLANYLCGTRRTAAAITSGEETVSPAKRYSGRVFDRQAIEQIRSLIQAHLGTSRQQLSYRVCEVFGWRKPEGSLKDMSCRVALLRMHREGLIELPAPPDTRSIRAVRSPGARRRRSPWRRWRGWCTS